MNTAQDELKVLLKTKGTGQTMSKALDTEACSKLLNLSQNPDVNPVTLSTLFTALYMLERTKEEDLLFDTLKHHTLFKHILKPQHQIGPILQKLLHYKSLNTNELQACCHFIFGAHFDAPLAAALFEALRLKRESHLENRMFLEHVRSLSTQEQTKVKTLVNIADPFDGLKKGFPIGLFIASLLASFSIPCLVEGAQAVGPKFGLTYPMLLKALNKKPFNSPSHASKQLENPKVSWAYLDQSTYSTCLHKLVGFRIAMVKRSVFSTIEKFLKPIRPLETLIHISSYTHPPYKNTLYHLLAEDRDETLILRGFEGSSQLPLDRRAPFVYFNAANQENDFYRPEDFGLSLSKPYESLPITLNEWVHQGRALLEGKESALLLPVIYNTQVILTRFSHCLPQVSTKECIEQFKSGAVKARWDAYD